MGEALKGKLTISRANSNRGPGYIKINLIDDISGCRVAEVHIDPASFAEALTGLGRVECEFDPPPRIAGLIGAQHEHKSVPVRLPDGYALKPDDPEVIAALAEHEVDGWRADRDQVNNPHHGPNHARQITYRRYIGADGRPIELPPR